MSHGFTIRLMDRDCLYNYQSRRFPTNGISTGIRLLIFMPTWNCSKHAFQFSPIPWSEITCPFTKYTLVIYYEGLEFSSAGYSNEDENIYLRNDFRPPQDWHAISRICGSAQTWRILFLPLESIPWSMVTNGLVVVVCLPVLYRLRERRQRYPGFMITLICGRVEINTFWRSKGKCPVRTTQIEKNWINWHRTCIKETLSLLFRIYIFMRQLAVTPFHGTS